MMYFFSEEEGGDYLTDEGKRGTLHCCRRIRTRAGVNEGWTFFQTLEDCLNAWKVRHEPVTDCVRNYR